MKRKTREDIKDIIKTLKNLPHATGTMRMSVQLPIEEWESILRLDNEVKRYKKAFIEMSRNYFKEKEKLEYICSFVNEVLDDEDE